MTMAMINKMNLLKIIVLAAALISAFPAMAQKLECRNFKETNELLATLKDSEVIDENSGKRAALIKIYTPFRNDQLGFDAGLFPILGRKQAAPGEIWLYVPERTQKVTVSHRKYLPTTIWFEGTEAEAGKTYTVELNVEGRDVTLVASTPGADITVDGEPQGKSPVSIHLPLGSHIVRAELGPLVYEDVVTVASDSPERLDLKMEDENLKFGDVDIEVANGAELWFQDRREGVGSLHKHLRAGSYVVTAKLPDHEDQTTTFTVEAGKSTTVTATPPVPHLGYLALTVEPAHGVTATMADSVIELLPTMQMQVANYEMKFSKKGYYPRTLRFRIEQGQTYADTVRMEKIQYVKKTTAYAAVAFAASGSPSVALALGGYYENVNIEASYSVGLGRSKDVTWYDRDVLVNIGAYSYRVDELAVHAGYQLRFAERFGLTPQLGFMIQRLSAPEKKNPGNGFTQPCVTVGARFAFHPIPHVGIFLCPEYGIPAGEKGDIAEVFSQGGITRGGIKGSIGISISI